MTKSKNRNGSDVDMSIEKEYGYYVPVCDFCGFTLRDCETFDDAVKSMKENGWKVRKEDGELKNICTDCLDWERGALN